jgi:hypothetical protein
MKSPFVWEQRGYAMIGYARTFVSLAAAAACVMTLPAQAACWSDEAVDAAKVRDLETMLMVSSLRCKLSGVDMLDDYNSFIRTSRPALTQVNDALRSHFGTGNAALNAYDAYVTKIANRYGGGAEGLNCRDMVSILHAANAEGGSRKGLSRLARDADVQPLLPGGQCAVTIATR